MDRQLKSPLLITPIGASTKLTPEVTYQHLLNFLQSDSSSFGGNNSVSKIQLERLTDALGVSIGKINTEEEERRENERKEVKLAEKVERRRLREEKKRKDEEEKLGKMVENLEGEEVGGEGEGDMENGAVALENEETMDDRGDIEYGDNVDDDNDEPDNEDEHHDQDEKMETDDE